ncbi:hypothetical protein CBR_g78631, partial [Chara braunii]
AARAYLTDWCFSETVPPTILRAGGGGTRGDRCRGHGSFLAMARKVASSEEKAAMAAGSPCIVSEKSPNNERLFREHDEIMDLYD